MNRRIIAAALATLAACTEPAPAQVVTRIDTELVKGRCRFMADDGEVGHYALKRCPGLGGARVYTTAGVHNVALSFKWGRREAEVFSYGSIGLKLEWRGTRTKQGFRPYAVIVERIFKDREDTKDRPDEHNVWAVVRIERRNACQMAVIDEAANPDPLAMARAVADKEAPGLSCAGLKPKVVGKETRWTQEAIGENQPPE